MVSDWLLPQLQVSSGFNQSEARTSCFHHKGARKGLEQGRRPLDAVFPPRNWTRPDRTVPGGGVQTNGSAHREAGPLPLAWVKHQRCKQEVCHNR